MTAKTTTPSYWLNWRFLICALFVLTYLALAIVLIWIFEVWKRSTNRDTENHNVAPAVVYKEEAWNTSFKCIHPAWLLCYRAFAFLTLLTLLVNDVMINGIDVFFFYTQWTFTLVATHFLLGFIISIYGCQKHQANACTDRADHASSDPEQGAHVDEPNESEHCDDRRIAGPWIHTFQIIYQASAGASMLTDLVFWTILFPFINPTRYGLNMTLATCLHSINAVFLLGDAMLNCMRFPFFRIAYFILWTSLFVLFQWIVHAFYDLWWPYPFLDLSPTYAPLWYLGIGLMHIPAYGIFALVIKVKENSFPRLFPMSYRRIT